MKALAVGTQVVVKDHGMGTIVTVGCPVFHLDDAYHVRIEGDNYVICFPESAVVAYADIYAGTAADPNHTPRGSFDDSGTWHNECGTCGNSNLNHRAGCPERVPATLAWNSDEGR